VIFQWSAFVSILLFVLVIIITLTAQLGRRIPSLHKPPVKNNWSKGFERSEEVDETGRELQQSFSLAMTCSKCSMQKSAPSFQTSQL